MPPDDHHLMRQAVDLAKACKDERADRASPRVGVVVVRNGVVLAEARRGQFDPGDHAEYCALEKLLPGVDLTGTTVYTTLEPCSSRGAGKVPCAIRLIERRVGEVVIGIYDPDPRVNRKGWKLLRDAGVTLRNFPTDLRKEILADNDPFLRRYSERRSTQGTDMSFDYTRNNGRFVLGEGEYAVKTRWSGAGHNSIYAYGDNNNVALARYAASFDEIDDPSALDFSSYAVAADTGDIVVFRNARGDHALVKVGEVLAGPEYDDEHTALTFSFEIRPRAQQ